jgi:hypothetical protein
MKTKDIKDLEDLEVVITKVVRGLDEGERGYRTPYIRLHKDNVVQATWFNNDGTRKHYLITVNEVEDLPVL